MPLSDEASLFVPYEVYQVPNREVWVSVQVVDEELIYISPIEWPTQAEAERHAHDLNYLRERTIESMGTTNLWVSVDIAGEGPPAMLLLEKALSERGVLGWRLLNPATDDDNAAWESARKTVLSAVETIGQEELPFAETESLYDHLKNRHDFNFETTPDQPEAWYAQYHREAHDQGFDNDSHTHEWTDEEVETDGDAEEEGAHEDTDS